MITQDRNRQVFIFCAAVFLVQIGHNIQISNSQLILKQYESQTTDETSSTSFGKVAYMLSIATSFDFIGTAFGGLLARIGVSARDMLPVALVFRTLTIFASGILFQCGYGTALSISFLVGLDFFFVGILDTTRAIMPVILEPDSEKRSILNSTIETWFQLGNLLGPLLGGLILSQTHSLTSIVYIPAALLFGASLGYFKLTKMARSDLTNTDKVELIPFNPSLTTTMTPSSSDTLTISGNSNETLPPWWKSPGLIALFIMSGCSQFNRLKNVIPSVLVYLNSSPVPLTYIPLLTGLFGLGNAAGSFTARYLHRMSQTTKLLLGTLGLLIFGTTFCLRNIYLVFLSVVASNFFLGVATVVIGSAIQERVNTQVWIIGINRSWMRFSLLLQKAFIAITLQSHLFGTDFYISLFAITALFCIMALVQLICIFWMMIKHDSGTFSIPKDYQIIIDDFEQEWNGNSSGDGGGDIFRHL